MSTGVERATGAIAGITTRRAWLIIGVVFVQWLIGYFDRTAMSVIAVPVSREFGLNSAEMGLVFSAFFLGFAIMTPVGGYLADRYGARRVLLVIMVLWSIFTGLTALAWSLASLIVLRALFGASEGSFPPTSSVAVAELLPVRRRGRAKSLLMSGAALGTAVGAYVVATLTEAWGWRTTFWIFCIIGLALSVVFMVVSRPMVGPRAPRTAAVERVPVRKVIASPLVWKLAIMQFGVGTFGALGQWMPSYWVEVKGLKLTTAGLATAVPSLVAFVAMIGIGFAADRLARREGRTVACFMAVSILFLYLTYSASTVVTGVLFLSVAQIAVFASAPLLSIVILKRMRRTVTGTATGITAFGQEISGVIAPTAMGALIQVTGGSYAAAFGMAMAVMGITLLVGLIADRGDAGELAETDDTAAHQPPPGGS